jgi:hypothetical protein
MKHSDAAIQANDGSPRYVAQNEEKHADEVDTHLNIAKK